MAEKPDKAETKPESKPTPPPAPPRPVRMDVTSSGKNGQYTFDVQVMSDKGRGIQADIRILEGTAFKPQKQQPTTVS